LIGRTQFDGRLCEPPELSRRLPFFDRLSTGASDSDSYGQAGLVDNPYPVADGFLSTPANLLEPAST
jgi:hypothetical protein